jgi:hypothetical protein
MVDWRVVEMVDWRVVEMVDWRVVEMVDWRVGWRACQKGEKSVEKKVRLRAFF